jgi:hypothetical protein
LTLTQADPPDDELAVLDHALTYPDPGWRPRPANYMAAVAALRKCLRADHPSFLAAYEAACAAVAECLATDECATWPAPEAFRSYVQQGMDTTLERLERRAAAQNADREPSGVFRQSGGTPAMLIRLRAIRRHEDMSRAAKAAREQRIEREGREALAWMKERCGA